jgi:hypothetical protein
MLYGNHTSLTFENVKSNLLSKEKFDDDSCSKSKGEGFIVRGRTQQAGSSNKPKSRSKSRYHKSNTFCRYCKADNHVISQCPKLKNKEERQNKKEGDKSAVEASIVEDNDGGEALMIIFDDEKCMAWVLDSTCSFYICSHREWFSDYSHVHDGDVIIGDESPLEISGIGSIQIKDHDGTFKTLTNVRYVPKMMRNLISLGTLEAMGFKFFADNGVLKVSQGNRVVLKAEHINNLYYLKGSTVTGTVAVSIASNTSNTKLWHMHLGHMSETVMHLLHKRGYLNDIDELEFSEHCVFGKQKRVSFSLSTHCTKGILDYIHSNIWGRTPYSSIGGCDYMITFIDDFSRKVWVYFLKHKNDALTAFKQWKALVENQIGRKIKKLSLILFVLIIVLLGSRLFQVLPSRMMLLKEWIVLFWNVSVAYFLMLIYGISMVCGRKLLMPPAI